NRAKSVRGLAPRVNRSPPGDAGADRRAPSPRAQPRRANPSDASSSSTSRDRLRSLGVRFDDRLREERAGRDGDAGSDLVDEARERGIDFVDRSGGPGKATILEANGAGVALIDLGDDGDLDVVFAQGLESLEALQTGPGADLEVFENDGSGHF